MISDNNAQNFIAQDIAAHKAAINLTEELAVAITESGNGHYLEEKSEPTAERFRLAQLKLICDAVTIKQHDANKNHSGAVITAFTINFPKDIKKRIGERNAVQDPVKSSFEAI